MMLRYLQLSDYADHLETAQKHVIYEGKYHTKDLRGSTTTKESTDGVESALQGGEGVYLQLSDYADHLETAQKHVIYEGKYHTKDLRGSTTTKESTDGVESALQ
ncbi:isocitrate dehydrogenase [NAD] regulatory subunit 3, mitochondrial-like protein [Tanacetum coccineum]